MLAMLKRQGLLQEETMELRALQDRTRNSNGPGTVDLLCYKSKLRMHFVNTWGPEAKLEDACLKRVKKSLANLLLGGCTLGGLTLGRAACRTKRGRGVGRTAR